MDSNTQFNSFQHLNQQPNNGLLRFRSAPSSILASLTDGVDSKGDQPERPDSERLISRFMHYNSNTDSDSSPSLHEFEEKSAAVAANRVASQAGYSGLPPHYPRPSMTARSLSGSFGLVGSNLSRQSSSPAGLFPYHSVHTGYRGVGSFGGVNGEVSPTSNNRLRSQISFSSRQPSSLGMLAQISQEAHGSIVETSTPDLKLVNGNDEARSYGPAFSYGFWNDSSHGVENFGGMKRDRVGEGKFSFCNQNGELGNRVHLLSHHLSLPKTSEVVAMEKFLQFQDAVPCKIRAKRGCATHPRSIAERVRRTRISERMRKLQELVPNMDKQTNTADMLEFAVEYIKDLQKQFKTLSDSRANCKCLGTQKSAADHFV